MCEFKDLTRIYDFAENLEEIVKLVKLAESKIDLYNKEDNYKNIIWMKSLNQIKTIENELEALNIHLMEQLEDEDE